MTERGFDVAHIDELDSFPVVDEGLVWRPVRRRFGIESFGVNAYSAAVAGDRVVEEHTESQNHHEELYFVVTGRAVFTLDGEEVDAPAGTFVFVRPGTRRGAVARADGTTVLALGGRRGEPFKVSGWESSFAAFALQRKGDNEGALAAMQEGLERYPDAWEAHYNASCLHSLLGDFDGALEHLRQGVELNGPEVRKLAAEDSDFDAIRHDPRFASAIAG